MSPIVYLCGGINGLSDAECKDWRERAKQYFPNALDPMRRDYRGKEAENSGLIVAGDLNDLNICDVVLAMCPRPSWGTAMEIFYACAVLGKAVYAVVPDRKTASPWLLHHAWLCESLDAAIDEITLVFK